MRMWRILRIIGLEATVAIAGIGAFLLYWMQKAAEGDPKWMAP
jgi:hypothetical protein